jgi:hypothetical protein
VIGFKVPDKSGIRGGFFQDKIFGRIKAFEFGSVFQFCDDFFDDRPAVGCLLCHACLNSQLEIYAPDTDLMAWKQGLHVPKKLIQS